MAEDMNRVILIGRLTRDAELTFTQSGFALTKMGLAVNRRTKKGDEYVEKASFFDVVLWGKRGEALAPYLLKGQQIAVEGSLKQDRWEQESQKRSKVIIEASNIQLLGGNKEASPKKAPQKQGYTPAEPEQQFTDDIPF